MNKTRPLTLTLFALLLGSGCSQDDGTSVNPPTLEVTWLTTLPNLVLGTTTYNLVQVQILGVDPQKLDSVKAYIQKSPDDTAAAFFLYDDASAFSQDDALDFCDSLSGDLVANNGVFSRRVNAQFAAMAGPYTIVVNAWADDQWQATPEETFNVALSLPPQLSNLIFAEDTLSSGFAPLQISLQAIDPDLAVGDSVVSVQMQLYSIDSLSLGDPIVLVRLDELHFGTTLAADFAIGHPSAPYIFAFRAWDTFSMISDSLGDSVYMENLAPHLIETIYPHTVQLPSTGGSLPVLISIRGWDDQTNADIQFISFLSQKPDSSYANNGQPIPLLDNGLPFDPARWEEGYLGDLVSGDSLFSATAVLYDTSQTGVYRFTFQAQDLAGNQNELMDSLWVTP